MDTIRTILYATDFSEPSRDVFPFAVALARDYGARLIVAHVMPLPITAITPGSLAVIEPEGNPEGVEEYLRQFDPHDPRVRVEHQLTRGDAATLILEIARASRCDLIVMGTHGRSGIHRLLAGSVAEQVIRHAPCPVLTVRGPSLTPTPATDMPSATAPSARVTA